jgi:transposase
MCHPTRVAEAGQRGEMSNPLPEIKESEADLKKLLRQEKGVRYQRVQMLYLFVTEQAHTRSQVARLLGIHRNTIRHWLESYASGGLATLLTVHKAPGRVPTLSAEQMERLRRALAQPAGFGSYGEVRDWIEQELGVAMQYETVRKLVRYRLGAKLKRARPTHLKKTS